MVEVGRHRGTTKARCATVLSVTSEPAEEMGAALRPQRGVMSVEAGW